jgi:hypothetical protein
MKKILLEALLYPIILFILSLGVGIPLVFIGFQALRIECTRNTGDTVSCKIVRKHFFGLYTIKADIASVKGAHMISKKGFDGFMTSGAYLITPGKDVPLLLGMGKSDVDVKKNVIGSINVFVQNQKLRQLSDSFKISNIFGMVGLPFLAFGILGIMGWPSAIINAIKKLKAL